MTNLLLSFCLLWAPLLPAQEAAAGNDRPADRQALRELRLKYEAAINQGSFDTLKDSIAPGASVVFMTGDQVTGIEAMQTFYNGIKKQLGEGSSFSVALKPEKVEFFGDIAVAHGTSDETVVPGHGSPLTYRSLWTAVLHHSDNRWQALRLHVSIDPINNPIVAAKTRLSSGLALAGGLGIGVILTLIMTRRKRAGKPTSHPSVL